MTEQEFRNFLSVGLCVQGLCGANFDVQNEDEDGTVFFSATDPIPIYQ